MRRLAALALLCACSSEGPGEIEGPDDPRFDPEECAECHPRHHRQWLGSMHAYAAEDPLFLAMNARGQRETNGELGDFCVQCHAPMAVRLGLTDDGLNLDEVPQKFKGVTCYFCHNVEAIEGTHNNPLKLANSEVMFGPVRDPVDNDFHRSEYSPRHDELTLESADMCGSCHDIVNPHEVALERTYQEWLGSFFSDRDPLGSGPAVYALTCGSCHMGPAESGPIAEDDNVRGDRFFHPHSMVGVDIALTDFPDAQLGAELRAEQAVAYAEQRRTALCSSICVNPGAGGGTDVDVYLHNEFSAHAWPSGASQDRRAWLEMHVFEGDSEVLSTGVVPDDVALLDSLDPLSWWFGDTMTGADGEPVHMFWEAVSTTQNLLPPAGEFGQAADTSTWRSRRFHIDGDVTRITTRVRLRPIDFDVVDDLIESGDLDPAIRDAIPTFDVTPSTVLEWTDASADFDDIYGPCVSSSPECGAPAVMAMKPE